MTWQYRIDIGTICHDGLRIGAGYSGHADGCNNPRLFAVADVGPLCHRAGLRRSPSGALCDRVLEVIT